jgi:hypothetical protein
LTPARLRHVLGVGLIAVHTALMNIPVPNMRWRARALGISEADVIKNVMLKETIVGEFATVRSGRVRPALKTGVNDRARALSSFAEGPMRLTQHSPWRWLRPSRVDVQTADRAW